jgi:2-polyprenyl-3-methyl-5-hydroxy-6-metoxy-1,4-benzoquinol methylase
MPTVEMNRTWWDGADTEGHWTCAGNDWSDAYGDPATQWFGSILPRLHRFIPTGTILEIAPGFGRWTNYLHHVSNRLIVVDLSARCIEACKARFQGINHIEYHVNDGRSLAMVDAHSVDLVFSFDSLVHVEMDIIRAYLSQLGTILSSQGAAFLHHSNLGACIRYFERLDRIPRGRGLLARLQLVDGGDQKRAKTVTADAFKRAAEDAGLRVVTQEIINWRSRRPIDCISVITRPGSKWDRGFRRDINMQFDAEAAYLRRLSALYGAAG